MKYKDFTELPVWQRAFALILKVYRATKAYPREERYGLVSDMRRAANTILHNIAEGFGRKGNKDKNNFYTIARGNAHELHSQALIAHALGFLSESDKTNIISDCKSIIAELNSIMKYLSQPQPQPQP